jgi:DNA-binding NtrC family response regulator
VRAQEDYSLSYSLSAGGSLADFIAEQERRFIEETIRLNEGARDRAAQMLGISTATLYRKMDAAAKRPKRKSG